MAGETMASDDGSAALSRSAPGTIVFKGDRSLYVIILIAMSLPVVAAAWILHPVLLKLGYPILLVLGGPLIPLVYLGYVGVRKTKSPPELEVCASGLRYTDQSLDIDGFYSWSELEGPERIRIRGSSLMQFRILPTNKTWLFNPSQFDASYDQMAKAVSEASKGRMLTPEEWNKQHPGSKALSYAVAIAALVAYFVLRFCIFR